MAAVRITDPGPGPARPIAQAARPRPLAQSTTLRRWRRASGCLARQRPQPH